ncbi:cytidylate kinase-like family protein [Granulosicoccus sp. 3-233]|uniref:cytidylate kinase-like family protein n=1 Tax=Granulosicoccus sp. 3-233 TaxID=3417969 RepID=UPI003D3597C6
MDSNARVEQFISDTKSRLVGQRKRLPPGTLPFVTITSQSGAGGNILAKKLLEHIDHCDSDNPALKGWRIFDKSMCQQVLTREHLATSMNDLLDEKYHSQIAELVMGIFGDQGMQNAAYARLSRFLRTVASLGKVIILGHGGAMSTLGLAGGNHLRLVAPLSARVARMTPVLQLDEAHTLREIQQRDRDRRQLWKTHYQIDSADPEHYDLVCNTDRVSIDTIARMQLTLILEQLGERQAMPA